MKMLILISVIALALAACGSPTRVEVEVTRIVETELEVTREVDVIVEVLVEVPVEVTREVIVTVILPTDTPSGPTATPTITNTPVPTNTPKPTEDVTKQSRGDGFYLVGSEIAPGVWRSAAGFSSCYWSVTTSTGDIIDNHFGNSGGTMYVPATGFQVELDDCGTFEWIGP